MSWTIKEAAAQLGLTAHTIRNHIKSGKIPNARLVEGRFGQEWVIDALPRDIGHSSALKVAKDRSDSLVAELEGKVEALNRLVAVQDAQIATLKEERDKLQQDNLNLARLAGQLEAQAAPKQIGKSWWQRLFGK